MSLLLVASSEVIVCDYNMFQHSKQSQNDFILLWTLKQSGIIRKTKRDYIEVDIKMLTSVLVSGSIELSKFSDEEISN